jgi:hypothetical protein
MVGTEREAVIDTDYQRFKTERETAIVAQYRATRQFKDAWKIISSDPRLRADCEYALVYAILYVRYETLQKKLASRGEHKKELERGVKKLRSAEKAVRFNFSLIDDLKRERKAVENILAIMVVPRRRPRPSQARALAVHHARKLLLEFGNKPPAERSRGGTWHRLAKVLFGDKRADLFEYIERYNSPELEMDFTHEVETQKLTLLDLEVIVGNRLSF